MAYSGLSQKCVILGSTGHKPVITVGQFKTMGTVFYTLFEVITLKEAINIMTFKIGSNVCKPTSKDIFKIILFLITINYF